MKHQIYIRTDGGQAIGLGHLVRCMALAQMLQDEFTIAFACMQIPESFRNEIVNSGFAFITLTDEEQFRQTITSSHIVILDGYHFDAAYQQKIKASGATLVCIDDVHEQPSVADLIINHAPGVVPADYRAQLYTQFALGPDYALLRPVFLKQARQKRLVDRSETVLICFGGSDHKNLTKITLGVVNTFSQFKRIVVVTGAAYAYTDSLQEFEHDARIEHLQAIADDEMLLQMTRADLAIVPASGILLEALAAGCKIISGMYVENQKFIYERYRNAGAFEDAGDFHKDALTNAIGRSFHRKPGTLDIIDGNSGQRLLKRFRQLATGVELELRRATDDDLEATYGWAIDPKVRLYSFSQHQISREEHTAWFKSKIRDEKCFYFVALLHGSPVGSIRFDIKDGDAVISYLIDPRLHGKNLGQVLLSKGLMALTGALANRSDIRAVIGYVMKANIPSIKAFENLGFSKSEESDKFKFQKVIE